MTSCDNQIISFFFKILCPSISIVGIWNYVVFTQQAYSEEITVIMSSIERTYTPTWTILNQMYQVVVFVMIHI